MKTLILGLDAFDPKVFEHLYEQNRLPNLSQFVKTGGYSRFSVSNPPQSEVSWTSIATGLSPGSHGIFDFVHRDPASYQPYVSLLPTKRSLGGIQFTPPHNANTIFQKAAQQGYPATSLWWPLTFPARLESPVRTIPGLGTPDIHGRLGVGTLFTTVLGMDESNLKTVICPLTSQRNGIFTGTLNGPSKADRNGSKETRFQFSLEIIDSLHARLHAYNMVFELELGKWSQVLELGFKINLFYSIRVVTRVILTSLSPEVQLYFLPLQIHPLKSPWRYGTPPGFIKESWTSKGPFLTLGWPQDTTGLEEGWINDDQFLSLCESIIQAREQVFQHHIQTFREGIFAIVYDSLDRIQHMFWRDRPDVIEAWYERLDALVGRAISVVQNSNGEDTRILIVSDHGFTDFAYKVHLNRWLIERGYLVTNKDPLQGSLKDIDWSQTQAYAVGLNSLYLNIKAREGQGVVDMGNKDALTAKLIEELNAWNGPDSRPVIQHAYSNAEIFEGPFNHLGPDILVGYASGYRASQETGLGDWQEKSIVENEDHWGADHCIDAEVVPGVIFSNHSQFNSTRPSYKDIPRLAVDMNLDQQGTLPPPAPPADEDQEILEERMKSLGYL